MKYFLTITLVLIMASVFKSLLPKIFYRYDQTIKDTSNELYQNSNVWIVAPKWVSEGLKRLSTHIPMGTKFEIIDANGIQDCVTIDGELSLKQLVMIARNEPKNINGAIDFLNYEPLITDKSVIYAIKDLARHCVIVGKDKTTHYGGYPKGKPVPQSEAIYIVDLIGLQFQMSYNSGRLVLIEDNPTKGLLDELIFESVVGDVKKTFKEVEENPSRRYVKHGDVYFDSFAYKKFVENDVLISGLALNEIADEELNFKFLKYGTGFFAGYYSQVLNHYIYEGLADGLSRLFTDKRQKLIKAVELPFYKDNGDIRNVCAMYDIDCKFSRDDALKKTHASLTTATTNCADGHVVTGNEMQYSSVDAAIGRNLESKANIFSPLINKLMREKFITLSDPQIDTSNTSKY